MCLYAWGKMIQLYLIVVSLQEFYNPDFVIALVTVSPNLGAGINGSKPKARPRSAKVYLGFRTTSKFDSQYKNNVVLF